MDPIVFYALSLAALFAGSAFFSGSETALVGSGRVKLTHLAEQGSLGAQRALKLLRDPSLLLAALLVGNNLINTMAAAVATTLMGPVWATVFVTLALLILGEITPKTIAASHPERFASLISGPVRTVCLVLTPIARLLGLLTRGILHLFGIKIQASQSFSRQELITAIRMGAQDGQLEPSETRMTREILRLKDTPVRHIMLPIDDVDGLPEAATFDEVMELVARTSNTRYPVYRGDPKHLVGLLMAKDLLVHQEGARENWLQYVRPLQRRPDHQEVDELLRDMQISRSHMSIVVDAEDRVVGIVTMEDILEEIVGEIFDEFDDEEGDLIREVSPGRYFVRGDLHVDDLCKVINVDLPHSDAPESLRAWFERRCKAGAGASRRMKVAGLLILQRGENRFEILVKHSLKEAIRAREREAEREAERAAQAEAERES
jgi:CBS domain containing-hemolysin-like protein